MHLGLDDKKSTDVAGSADSAPYRPLPAVVAVALAVLLTSAAAVLIPPSDDAIGWGVRVSLFLGMCWAVR
jgi:hypothetical protein